MLLLERCRRIAIRKRDHAWLAAVVAFEETATLRVALHFHCRAMRHVAAGHIDSLLRVDPTTARDIRGLQLAGGQFVVLQVLQSAARATRLDRPAGVECDAERQPLALVTLANRAHLW